MFRDFFIAPVCLVVLLLSIAAHSRAQHVIPLSVDLTDFNASLYTTQNSLSEGQRVGSDQLSRNIARLNGRQGFIGLFHRASPLNADLLNGLDSGAFARAQHRHSATDIVSGILSDARLSSNVALLSGSARFSGSVTAPAFYGSGAFLSNLPAANLVGPVSDGQLSPNVPLLSSHQTFTGSNTFTGVSTLINPANFIGGTFAGDGIGLDNLNAGRLTVGTVPDARLPSNIARLDQNQTHTGTLNFNPASGPPFVVGSSNRVENLNSTFLDGLDADSLWRLGGNNTTNRASVLGTLGEQPLDLLANGSTVMRLHPHGQFVYPMGSLNDGGKERLGLYVLRQTTTNSAPTEMFLDGQSQRIVVPLNTAWAFEIVFVGVTTNEGGGAIVNEYRSSLANLNGTIKFGSATYSDGIIGSATGSGVVTSNGETLVLQVRSAGNFTVRWVAMVRTTEVEF